MADRRGLPGEPAARLGTLRTSRLRRTLQAPARRSSVIIIAAAAWVIAGSPAESQVELELRASTEDYRFVDLSYAASGGPVLDAVYVKVTGLSQTLLGAGWDFELGPGKNLIPLVYRASGDGGRGVTIGGLVSFEGERWKLLGFAGHFIQWGGEISSYSFLDEIEVTRLIGRWEIGGSADVYEIEDDHIIWLIGPVLKREDSFGVWGVSVRSGDATELRVSRGFVF